MTDRRVTEPMCSTHDEPLDANNRCEECISDLHEFQSDGNGNYVWTGDQDCFCRMCIADDQS